MNHFPVPLSFRAQERLHVARRAIICRVGTLKLCVKADTKHAIPAIPLIIRLCRQSLTEIDIRVNLFQICWPCRGEVASSSKFAQTRVSILSKHVKSGSNYHRCSICISQSDKLVTLCDILTVSPGAAPAVSQQTHLTQRLYNFPKLQFHIKERGGKTWTECARRTLMLSACKTSF